MSRTLLQWRPLSFSFPGLSIPRDDLSGTDFNDTNDQMKWFGGQIVDKKQ